MKFSKNGRLYLIITTLLLACLIFFVYETWMHANCGKNNGLHVVFDIKQNRITPSSTTIPIKVDNKVEAEQIVKAEDEKYVHIIIADVGLNIENSKKVTTLPTSITLGISPYGYNLSTLSKISLDAGYNLLMNLPLEPMNPSDDAGSFALLTTTSVKDNMVKLQSLASKIDGIIGFYTMPQEKLTSIEEQVQSLLEFCKNNNLLLVYSTPNENNYIKELANSLDISTIHTDLILDEDLSSEGILSQLAKLEQIINTNGKAIVIGRAYPLTIEMIKQWITTIDDKKITLVNIKDFIVKSKNNVNVRSK